MQSLHLKFCFAQCPRYEHVSIKVHLDFCNAFGWRPTFKDGVREGQES